MKIGLYGDIGVAEDQGEHAWRLLAFDKHTGKEIFNTLAHKAIPRSLRHAKATHCNSTPATNGKFIVTYFGSEGLFCFNIEGKLLWRKDLGYMDAGYFNAATGNITPPGIQETNEAVLFFRTQKSLVAIGGR